MKGYEDEQGRIYRVSSGISGGEYWMTVRTKPMKAGFCGTRQGGQHRVVSKSLPLRETPEVAQMDLDDWAKKKNLRRISG